MDGLIYAYSYPRSAGQRAYTEARLAQLAQQRRELQQQQRDAALSHSLRKSSQDSAHHIERRGSRASQGSSSTSPPATLRYSRKCSWGEVPRLSPTTAATTTNAMDNLVARTMTGSSHTSQPGMQRTLSEQQEQDLLSNPFELRHGRRYLRDVPYPLPCDLAETQRQNLRTLLSTSVFGGVICSPKWDKEPPKRVLDVGCGSGYWSALCHDYFAEKGFTNIEFVGMDIAPLAPNLNKQGVNWKFVHHDVRRTPWPFDDGEFDLVFLKDLSMLLTIGGPSSEKIMADCVRLVREGGVMEVWESDHILRSLTPEAPPPPSKKSKEQDIAEETATFALAPGHPFIPAQSKFIHKANTWVAEALDRRKLHPTPCASIAETLLQEPGLRDFGQRRVAIPLGELRWERKASQHKRNLSNGHDSPMSTGSRGKDAKNADRVLTPGQAALRQTALITHLQMIESMEPILKEASGKNTEEWGLWWANMMSDLLDPIKSGVTGECLEIGAWWGTKVAVEE